MTLDVQRMFWELLCSLIKSCPLMNGHPPVDFPLIPLSYLCAQVAPGSKVGVVRGTLRKNRLFSVGGGVGRLGWDCCWHDKNRRNVWSQLPSNAIQWRLPTGSLLQLVISLRGLAACSMMVLWCFACILSGTHSLHLFFLFARIS